MTTTSRTAELQDANSGERGAAMIVLLFALPIFSVLSLTVLRNAGLEAALRTSDNPDLHVVLYAAGAGSPHVVGRLNLPTIGRLQKSADASTEIRTPGPVASTLAGDFQPRWAYVVQLADNLRVCCDNGDGACSNINWDEQVPEGILTPAVDRPLVVTKTERQLQFSLSSAEIADNVALDPDAVTESSFLIKATRIPEGVQSNNADGAGVSCRLDTRDTQLATGTLRLQPGSDRLGRMNRVSTGSLDLTYRVPKN